MKLRRLFGHKEAALALMLVFLWLGLVAELWVGWAAFAGTAFGYVLASEGPK